jgi:tetratricopeptide (TPR) repeat protein
MRFVIGNYTKLFIFAFILIFSSASIYSQNNVSQFVKIGDIKVEKNAKSAVEKWREDLEFIKTELPAKHKNLFHRLDREKFYKEIADLDAKIPTLTQNQVALEFERIVGLARDGHTWTSPLYTNDMNFQLFPINMYMFGDEMYIRKADAAYKDIVGGKVLKIGKMTTAEAVQKVGPYMSTDNEMGIKNAAPIYLASPQVLQALGISDNLEKVSLELEKDGKVFTKEVSLMPNKDNSRRAVRDAMKGWVDANANAKNPTPLTRKNPGKIFWFEYVKDEKLLYVQLNGVGNDENKTLEQFFGEVFDFAGKNELDKFVLDIRYNGGGNNTLIKPIIRGLIKLDNIDRKGHLFVITGRQTFSAAQNLTNELENWTNAVFVGEPTASHVNMYGDARHFALPNSKMPIFISELWWQNKHARDERKWTAPNIAAELTFEDYVNNIDPPMKAILEYKPQKTLREIGLEAYQTRNFKGLKKTLIDFRKNPVNKYYDVEDEVNGFGYNLIRMNKLDDAIEVFKLNVELYPESFNVYDSLAESYMIKGEKELAIKFYKKSLELNPNNTNAVQMLEQIEKGGH